MDHLLITGYPTTCGSPLLHVEPGLDHQMEIQGQILSQGNDTLEASTSAPISMPLIPQQLAATDAPGSAQSGTWIQMQAPLPSNAVVEAPASPQQQWPQ
ncbi:hypothetical protein ACP70R_032288 [Stipagrostis hirtigluma subsp. patula]